MFFNSPFYNTIKKPLFILYVYLSTWCLQKSYKNKNLNLLSQYRGMLYVSNGRFLEWLSSFLLNNIFSVLKYNILFSVSYPVIHFTDDRDALKKQLTDENVLDKDYILYQGESSMSAFHFGTFPNLFSIPHTFRRIVSVLK